MEDRMVDTVTEEPEAEEEESEETIPPEPKQEENGEAAPITCSTIGEFVSPL
jgi:hypothetical protein